MLPQALAVLPLARMMAAPSLMAVSTRALQFSSQHHISRTLATVSFTATAHMCT
jgi:hypothetical protein